MKKNHFYISYTGNKRSEVKTIYDNLNFDNITTIIEPFCGSCAISYYISTLHPKKYKYILNDINNYLKDIYDIIKNNKCEEFENTINNIINKINNKEDYMGIIKNNNLYGWYIKNHIYKITPGLFPDNFNKEKKNSVKLSNYLIYNFFINEDIIFTTENGLDCYLKYKNDIFNMIIFDPPYLNSCNDFYEEKNVNIYEYINNNNIINEICKIYLILENSWIIKLLFRLNIICEEYDKKYITGKKRKTTHIIIKNY
jgi:site-specific DNA-adenine methylase